MIILDSSPLIHLTKIGKIEFLFEIFEYIIITPTVFNEVIDKGIENRYDDAIFIKGLYNKELIKIKKPTIEDDALKTYLHPGEAETILLGQETKMIIIIDEKKGRFIADQKRVINLSTLDILLLLIKEKKIDIFHFNENLDRYSTDGWIGASIINQYKFEGKKYE